jgi:aspartate/tyrosine/aromatic aminotransferase
MFENFDISPPEVILQIAAAFNADPRAVKMDLGVGVYRDDQGRTPVMAAVKTAEQRILDGQLSKTYMGLLGDTAFTAETTRLALGELAGSDRVSALQTPGGSGALRLCFDMVRMARADATVWLPDPTWINHAPTLAMAGLTAQRYPYYDAVTGTVRFEEMRAALALLGPGDVVLLHGCCHNPTGADLSPEHWDDIAALAAARGFLPLLDLAYQGLGAGLEEDAYGTRAIAAAVPEMLMAYSCSKNFAIYRERTGFALALSRDAQTAARTLGKMKQLVRANHSMPPDHGAAVVRTILQDSALAQIWRAELEQMRQRIIATRTSLAAQFRKHLGSGRLDFIADQQGMFSVLPVTPEHAETLRRDHAIYIVPDGRINIAGLLPEYVEPFVAAVAQVAFGSE